MTGLALVALAVVGQCLPCDVAGRVRDASSAVLSPVVSPLLELGERGAELVEPVVSPVASVVLRREASSGASEAVSAPQDSGGELAPSPESAETSPGDVDEPAEPETYREALAKLLATVSRLNVQLSQDAIARLLVSSPEYVAAVRESFAGQLAAAKLERDAAMRRGDFFAANQADRELRHWRETWREWDRGVEGILEAHAPTVDPVDPEDP